jgi:hypothetical protein
MPAGGKLVWTNEEDELLKVLVEKYGDTSWSAIAKDMGTKGSKQCRRRWKNVLTINAKCTGWTEEEDEKLIKYHRELGNKWTAISKRFGDRTDNATKNRWHALCRKRPELLSAEGPISKIGVKKGTKTHSLIMGDSTSVSDPSAGLQQYSSQAGAVMLTPFDQKDSSTHMIHPTDLFKQNFDPMALGSLQSQHFSRLSQLSNLARAFEEMKKKQVPSGQMPSMELSDSFQKWLGSQMFSGLPWGSMQMPSQPIGTLGELDNVLLANIASEGASKTEHSKETGGSKDVPGQTFDAVLQSNGLQNSLNTEQRDMLGVLFQQPPRKETDTSTTGGKRKRDSSSLDFDELSPPSNDDFQFLLSSLAKQMSNNAGS